MLSSQAGNAVIFHLPFPTAPYCFRNRFAPRRSFLSVKIRRSYIVPLASANGPTGDTDQLEQNSGTANPAGFDVSLFAATSFDRRALLGFITASGAALGGNLGGITSLLLGLNVALFRSLNLDILYAIQGYKRCLEKDFEFIYPAAWVGDQRLLYRAAERAEKERLYGELSKTYIGKAQVIEPVVAFGPPGSSGELNVSVIVAPVSLDFRLDKIGDPREAGERILSVFIKNSKVSPTLLNAASRADILDGEHLLYYTLEFSVQGQSFSRHNVSVYVAYKGQLFSLIAQTPEVLWEDMKQQFLEMAGSFKVRH